MSYGIYLYMQSASGRGPGAALGVLAIFVVGLGTWLSHRVAARNATRLGALPRDPATGLATSAAAVATPGTASAPVGSPATAPTPLH
jgi:iron(III) transport system permease protein